MYVTSPIKTIESQITLSPGHCDEFPSTHEVTFREGDNLFYTGDEADYVYEVVEGVVRSSKVLADGRRQVLNFCYAGEMIGLSHDSYYHCDCDAVSKVRVRLHRKNAFMKDIENDPEFCLKLLRKAAAEVNNMQDHFLMLGRKNAVEKISSFLVAIMDRQNLAKLNSVIFDLPMNRSDIADFLGMTIETVSRNFTKLRKMGVIDLPSTHQVRVVEPARLRSLAENKT
ncbi:MAG: helix-turn-helix domain-containing protein [Rhizobiaceae bacterium]|nr:helix-turn-helix domain-containing protein [Rhizobiaceae bacterium]